MFKPILALLISSFSATAFAHTFNRDDAEVHFDTRQNVVIQSEIVLYGEGATSDVAKVIHQNIMEYWAKDPTGNTWRYYDPTDGKTYQISFDVKVSLYGGKPRQKPEFMIEKWDPTNRKNYIEIVISKEFRSFVLAGDEGTWINSNAYNTSVSHRYLFAHEFGHLLGLPDRYHDDPQTGYSVTNPGWRGNIMGDVRGVVEQRTIDEIMKPIMEKRHLRNRILQWAGLSEVSSVSINPLGLRLGDLKKCMHHNLLKSLN